MQLFASYTFGQALLTVLEFALLFFWIWIAISVVVDIFRSQDLSGPAKAGWVLLIVVLPLLGVLVYLVARGDKMKAHELGLARSQEIALMAQVADLKDRGILTDEEFQRAQGQRQYADRRAASPDDDVAELEALRDRGLLTDEEFQTAKARALA
jgi:ABC-type multidrug transport system fused ATPase/permease subunit